MKRLLAVCVAVTAATACSLPQIGARPSAEACAAALLQGTLASGPDGTAVVSTESATYAVEWPDEYAVEEEPRLRLLNDEGDLVASEGDPIYVGGGFTPNDEVFIACGYVSSNPP